MFICLYQIHLNKIIASYFINDIKELLNEFTSLNTHVFYILYTICKRLYLHHPLRHYHITQGAGANTFNSNSFANFLRERCGAN